MPRLLKQDARKMLGNVPEENVFRCCDGRILANMLELGVAFGSMSDEVFVFHANPAKNDFTNWVRDIIKDDKLASDLLESIDQKQAANKVAERLVVLKKTLG